MKKFLIDIALGAGAIHMKYLGKTNRVEKKKNAGIVTEADKLSEKYLLNKIFRKYPESSIITEETGEYRRSSTFCWYIDPLDGTSNFAHGFPWFCVSIGVYEEDRPKYGVVYQPFTREIFYGEVGKGFFLNGKRMRVSKTKHLRDSLLGTGFYYAKGKTLRHEIEIFNQMNELALGVRRPGSAALDLSYVACGRYDGFWEKGLNSWDVAAGLLFVTEAGGLISDYDGKPTNLSKREVVAANPYLHSKITRVIQISQR